jgi:hypothetical protein
MKALLLDEQIIQVFKVTGEDGELTVTWNKDNNTESSPHLFYVPEFVVEDEDGEELVQGCQLWEDAVAAVKAWK